MFPNTQQANFTAMTDIFTQCLLQEQASLVHHQIQDLYSPTPGYYTAPVSTINTPLSAQEPVTPTSDRSVLADQFSAMSNIMQRL